MGGRGAGGWLQGRPAGQPARALANQMREAAPRIPHLVPSAGDIGACDGWPQLAPLAQALQLYSAHPSHRLAAAPAGNASGLSPHCASPSLPHTQFALRPLSNDGGPRAALRLLGSRWNAMRARQPRAGGSAPPLSSSPLSSSSRRGLWPGASERHAAGSLGIGGERHRVPQGACTWGGEGCRHARPAAAWSSAGGSALPCAPPLVDAGLAG